VKVSPYHTIVPATPPERNVYHAHDNCPDGRRLKAEHKAAGMDGRPRCDECIKLG
jgi:hypothetical protein